MSDKPVEIALALHPVANLFDRGNRIRVTIAGADKLGGTHPRDRVERSLTIFRDGEHESLLDLPVVMD